MDWKKEIIEGMKLISNGCAKNIDRESCDEECPFSNFCISIQIDHYRIPEQWIIKEEE